VTGEVQRIVALGASNLTRGFHAVVSIAREAWGPDVEIVAALGHGRSYGAHSRFVVRTLPGILASGLWRDLASRPGAPTRALVTDVGNDILYGFTAEQTLAWVAEALDRLRGVTSDVTLTDLPMASIRRLSPAAFLVFRSVLVPSCRLSFTQVLDRSERLNEGLSDLAVTFGARFVRLDAAWYGFDPIHIRPSLWQRAWNEILGQPAPRTPAGSPLEAWRLYFMRPERQWLAGMEQNTPQSGTRLRTGGRIRLY
jgi:hypothetical protein